MRVVQEGDGRADGCLALCARVEPIQNPRLTGELGPEKVPGNRCPGRSACRQGLGSSKARIVVAWKGRCQNQAAVPVDVDEGRAYVGQPSDGFEAHVSRAPQDDDPADTGGGSGEGRLASVAPDSVGDEQSPAANLQADAIAVHHEDAIAD